jgi:hypothetical protein
LTHLIWATHLVRDLEETSLLNEGFEGIASWLEKHGSTVETEKIDLWVLIRGIVRNRIVELEALSTEQSVS